MSLLQPVAPLPVTAPAVSLATTARRLPGAFEWRTGIAFRQGQCPTSGRWRYCPDGLDEKTADAGHGSTGFVPFSIYATVRCDMTTPLSADEQHQLVQDQLDAVTPWHLARELWTGEFNTSGQPNPTLQAPSPGATNEFDPSHVITSPDAAVDALGALYALYERTTKHGGGAVAHVPSELITHLFHQGLVKQQGDVFVAPNFVVSPGPGYPGSGAYGPKTAAHPSGATADSSHVWIYMTGPVEFATGEVQVLPEGSMAFAPRRTNRHELWAEAPAIVRFDPCSVFAALATIPTSE